MFKVYQVRITEDDTLLINSVGWSQAVALSPNVKAYTLATQEHKFQEAFDTGQYTKVSEIDATDLEETFTIGNCGPEDKITRFCSMRSVSVGDVVKDPKGRIHAVAPNGFIELTL